MTYTDAELTAIYNEANGIAEGKRPTITTARIFAAMRLAAAKERQRLATYADEENEPFVAEFVRAIP